MATREKEIYVKLVDLNGNDTEVSFDIRILTATLFQYNGKHYVYIGNKSLHESYFQEVESVNFDIG